MNYAALIKRANKVIDNAESKMYSAKVHIVDIDADISELQGLVLIMNRNPINNYSESTQAKSQPISEDFS